MKVRNLLGQRYKEAPADCSIDSQKLMVRGGYIKYMGNGIYSFYAPMKRISSKIEKIIREEMDRIDGQEVQFPVAMPASLWQESGRYESIGSELLRFTDRGGNKMVLGMTHEEASVHLARNTASSYTDYPFMIYQIQTKFRDEPRARGGLIRTREFTMKDAYSFHTSMEDLQVYYDRCFKAYERIFKRAGAKNVVAVKSDSGMMGGSVSHEFMLLSDIGEDTLAICSQCGYRANMEAAQCIVENGSSQAETLEKVYTPNIKTIQELCNFLKTPSEAFCKAVVYQRNDNNEYIVVFIRGDLEVNETKLRNLIKADFHSAVIEEGSGIVAGFIGPVGLSFKGQVIYDLSLKGIESLVCGANEKDHHLKGVNLTRDVGQIEYNDISKIYEGAICPCCGKPSITIKKGIEIGNIFQLGTKYSKAMNMTYLDKDGKEQYPIMGCYGIGVGRLAASICEESHDQWGPIWPITIAPWQIEICNLRSDDSQVTQTAEKLYNDLQESGIEVLYDDRDIRPGSMFADADLFGIPVRVVVSPKNLGKGVIEVSLRDKSLKCEYALDEAKEKLIELVNQLYEQYK